MLRHPSWVLCALLPLLGCPMPQRSFALVSLEEAQELLREGGLRAVDAEYAKPAPQRDSGAEAPPGGVLVIASTEGKGYRAAAALSRSGNHPIYLCISANAIERSRLYALAAQKREIASNEAD